MPRLNLLLVSGFENHSDSHFFFREGGCQRVQESPQEKGMDVKKKSNTARDQIPERTQIQRRLGVPSGPSSRRDIPIPRLQGKKTKL